MVTDSMIDNATRFVIANGRLVERRLLELVRGPAQPAVGHAVLAALDGCRNADGGLGHGLEADAQAPGSQPLAVDFPIGLNPTAGIVARLRRLGLTSAWLDRAEGYCRAEVERSLAEDELDGHTALNLVVFAAGIDDSAWAADQFRVLAGRLGSLTLFHLYPGEGYGLTPLEFAPTPGAAARKCFPTKPSPPTWADWRRRSRTTAAGRSPGSRRASSRN